MESRCVLERADNSWLSLVCFRFVRNDSDHLAFWMTGRKQTLHYLCLYRATEHDTPQLMKIAGDLQDRGRLVVVRLALVWLIFVSRKRC